MNRYAFSLLLSVTTLRAESEPPIIVLPNADSVLDAASLGQNEGGDATTNPFRVRYHPQVRIREIPLVITSILVGRNAMNASAIINGELYSPGDAWEGLSVAAISSEMIELRLGRFLLQAPVQDQPLTVRLTR